MATEARPRLVVYSRAYCHLCDEMIGALRELQGSFHFDVEIVDVDGDAGLERQYGEKVPVLAHGGRELCHYRLDSAVVTAYLSNFR